MQIPYSEDRSLFVKFEASFFSEDELTSINLSANSILTIGRVYSRLCANDSQVFVNFSGVLVGTHSELCAFVPQSTNRNASVLGSDFLKVHHYDDVVGHYYVSGPFLFERHQVTFDENYRFGENSVIMLKGQLYIEYQCLSYIYDSVTELQYPFDDSAGVIIERGKHAIIGTSFSRHNITHIGYARSLLTIYDSSGPWAHINDPKFTITRFSRSELLVVNASTVGKPLLSVQPGSGSEQLNINNGVLTYKGQIVRSGAELFSGDQDELWPGSLALVTNETISIGLLEMKTATGVTINTQDVTVELADGPIVYLHTANQSWIASDGILMFVGMYTSCRTRPCIVACIHILSIFTSSVQDCHI